MQHLILRNKAIPVGNVSRDLGIPLPITSQYLRTLNARGLLRARRDGRQVLYQTGDDPALPETRILLMGLRSGLKRGGKSIETVFSTLTGFTHPRRITLLRAVAHGSFSVESICENTGISRRAVIRHLNKLVRRGYLASHDRCYRVARPASPLARSLLTLALLGK